MKTVKDVSEISGVSIRTLRYYDEIGLLKPTELSDAGYRLYDNKALERLQEIMFFKELEIPLEDIKKIMDSPNYDKEQALLTQKNLLEQKRNRLNGIIELISDVMKGVNTMSFKAFSNEEIQEILDHMLGCMSKESLKQQIQKYGSEEKYREYLAAGFSNEQMFLNGMAVKKKQWKLLCSQLVMLRNLSRSRTKILKYIKSLWRRKKLVTLM